MLEHLPTHLRERSRVLSERPVCDGRFVLYWMHHALRTEENPALDAARHLAVRLDRPLLVVQGLGGAHPYSSDRHHLFALQCARDVAVELDALGIGYRFHLDARQHGSVPSLARDAAAVVVEEMPVPPMRDWQRRLVEGITAPAIAVDARCIVPMSLVRRRYDRAFAFRKATAEDYRARLLSTWPACNLTSPPLDPQVTDGAYPVAGRTDAQLLGDIAALPIDHSVAPVWHTPGGTKAAARRWETFRDTGLATYHSLRNDAAVDPPRGVSRLSAYLHYGCISPLRVAREAALAGGKGAEKFLDELFVWRELAHNFCFHTPDLNSLNALPSWARDTLAEHADDPRPVVHSWDTLAHARTGNELWDRAQRSLLIHGELHNNVRMTWAKQLLQWTDSPNSALAMLLDLNHRYALDGSDPNSYGGLLWAMGQFDRPFKPAIPVLGTVRPRSVSAHARRLDQRAWGARVDQPAGAHLCVAVVGAGAAGAAAARTLADHGHTVNVFEKSRGAGGRMATRRVDNGTFDHGAQYFSARDAGFRRRVAAWESDGLVAPWPARLVQIAADGASSPATAAARFTFVPGMNALAQHLLEDLPLHALTTVTSLTRADGGWLVHSDQGDFGPFDAVVLTPPAPQSVVLLGASDLDVPAELSDVDMLPCHAAMFTVALSAQDAGFDAAFVDDDDIAWLACDTAKPGRRSASGLHHWVVHATESFSRRHLDTDKPVIAEQLAASLSRKFPDWPRPEAAYGHRWRYARVAESAVPDVPFAIPVVDGVWVAGDACAGTSRVESAWLSGVSAAARVMARANVANAT